MKPLRQYLLFSKTSRSCGLVKMVLTQAGPAQGADPDLIGAWPGIQRRGGLKRGGGWSDLSAHGINGELT